MQALVTGGAGFIGSHIVELLERKGFAVRVLDNLRSGKATNLQGRRCELIQASVLDGAALRTAMTGVDYVFHLAAMISVPESMEHPCECNEINTRGTLMVLEEAAAAGVKKLVFSSSSAVYGDSPISPKVEAMAPDPKSPYAVTKLDGEYYCDMFSANRSLPTTSLRYFNVFGPRQDPNSQYAAVVPFFIQRALKREPLTIHGDGQQTRDFVYVKDVAEANVFFALSGSDGRGVFNVGCGHSITVSALAQEIITLTGSSSTVIHSEKRMGDVRHSQACTVKLSGAGFHVYKSLRSGLDETIGYFREMHRCESFRGGL